MPMVAWYVLSNESYMKRVMSDVLPTVAVNQRWQSLAGMSATLPSKEGWCLPLCSPRKTNL
jgi:hypothetical protein